MLNIYNAFMSIGPLSAQLVLSCASFCSKSCSLIAAARLSLKPLLELVEHFV